MTSEPRISIETAIRIGLTQATAGYSPKVAARFIVRSLQKAGYRIVHESDV